MDVSQSMPPRSVTPYGFPMTSETPGTAPVRIKAEFTTSRDAGACPSTRNGRVKYFPELIWESIAGVPIGNDGLTFPPPWMGCIFCKWSATLTTQISSSPGHVRRPSSYPRMMVIRGSGHLSAMPPSAPSSTPRGSRLSSLIQQTRTQSGRRSKSMESGDHETADAVGNGWWTD